MAYEYVIKIYKFVLTNYKSMPMFFFQIDEQTLQNVVTVL